MDSREWLTWLNEIKWLDMTSFFHVCCRVSCQCSTPLVPWFDHQKIFDLCNFGQLYINKPITLNQCLVAQVKTNWPEENIKEPQNLDNPKNEWTLEQVWALGHLPYFFPHSFSPSFSVSLSYFNLAVLMQKCMCLTRLENTQPEVENKQLSVWGLGLLELYGKMTIKIEKTFFIILQALPQLPAVAATSSSCHNGNNFRDPRSRSQFFL